MKKFKILKILRVACSLIIFCMISMQFLDVYHTLPKPYYRYNVIGTMFVPSLLKMLATTSIAAGSAFFTFVILSILFGRTYCSFACPFGTLMDILRRVSQFPAKSKLLKNTKFGKFCKKNFFTQKFHKSRNVVRGAFLAFATLAIIFGYGALLGLIEPYSLYGKIMGCTVHSTEGIVVDKLGSILAGFGVYSVPPVSGHPEVSLASFGLAILILIGIWLASAFRGRLYCNTICPVGAFLGIFSKFSIFKLSFDKSKCVSCGLCERNCKTECIDVKNKKIDSSKCVLCFNCASQCPKSAIKITTSFAKSEKPIKQEVDKCDTETNNASVQSPRRRTLIGGLATATAILCSAAKKDSQAGKKIQRNKSKCKNVSPYSLDPSDPRSAMTTPPGSKSVENFLEHCTGCQICTSACKAHILKPSITEWGLSGIMRPFMDYTAGFCLYECHNCSKVCPTGAIQFISGKNKRQEKIGTAIFDENLCVVKTDGTDCAACGEHCPVQAIELIPFGDPKNSLYIPHVHKDVCIGCGACEYICPVKPKKAIVVRGLAEHKKATLFDESMRLFKPQESANKESTPPTQNSGSLFPF